jgi:hypothetical protein
MNSPAASTLLIDSILTSIPTSEPIGSAAFTVSAPTPMLCNPVAPASQNPPPSHLVTKNGLNERATVRLSDLMDAFKACLANELIWIEDFSDDPVEISRDLSEVLQAFAEIRRHDVGEA